MYAAAKHRILIGVSGEEFRGDCMLNGEPSVPSMVRFGEKGTLRIIVEIDTPGAHAAYTHASPNAIRIATYTVIPKICSSVLPASRRR